MITGGGHQTGNGMMGGIGGGLGMMRGGAGGFMNGVLQLLFMMCLTAVDDIVKVIPILFAYVKERAVTYYGTKVKDMHQRANDVSASC